MCSAVVWIRHARYCVDLVLLTICRWVILGLWSRMDRKASSGLSGLLTALLARLIVGSVRREPGSRERGSLARPATLALGKLEGPDFRVWNRSARAENILSLLCITQVDRQSVCSICVRWRMDGV